MTARHELSTLTKSMPTDADTVFDLLTDLEHLSSWLPSGIEVELYGPGLLRLWVGGDEPVERHVRIDWENLRLWWGGPGAASYAGCVRVLPVAPGCSAVTVELTGPAGLPRPRLDDWLTRALDALTGVVATERPAAPRSTKFLPT